MRGTESEGVSERCGRWRDVCEERIVSDIGQF
jgi:hypothetical protein